MKFGLVEERKEESCYQSVGCWGYQASLMHLGRDERQHSGSGAGVSLRAPQGGPSNRGSLRGCGGLGVLTPSTRAEPGLCLASVLGAWKHASRETDHRWGDS